MKRGSMIKVLTISEVLTISKVLTRSKVLTIRYKMYQSDCDLVLDTSIAQA